MGFATLVLEGRCSIHLSYGRSPSWYANRRAAGLRRVRT